MLERYVNFLNIVLLPLDEVKVNKLRSLTVDEYDDDDDSFIPSHCSDRLQQPKDNIDVGQNSYTIRRSPFPQR